METDILLEQLDRYYTLWRESLLIYEEWSKSHGLSYNSVMVLYSIYEHKGCCTQKMISQKWLLPKQTINTILKDFEHRDFLVLSPSPSDKRNKLIQTTPAGEQYAGRIVTELRKLELFVLERMGAERVTNMNHDMELFITLFRKGVEKEYESEENLF